MGVNLSVSVVLLGATDFLTLKDMQLVKKKKESVEVSECETFQSYSEKLRQKYGENWLGKGKCTGLEFKRWLALRDNSTQIP